MLDIYTKDNRNLKLSFQSKKIEIYKNLNEKTFPKESYEYSRFSKEFYKKNRYDYKINGWKLYDAEKEYKRQGRYRLSDKNAHWELCETYPQLLVVPQFFTNEDMVLSSKFRTKNRLPVLTYHCNNDDIGKKSSSIWRSSQTMSGVTWSRNEKDERLLELINTYTSKLVIFDARPHLNAQANRLKGGGFENVDYYKKTELIFCEIGNIHDVSKSLEAVYTLCRNKDKLYEGFLSELEKTNWYSIMQKIIKSSVDVMYTIKEGNSVLIHCSDGWDRSSQLVSLSQILLEPYYRTLEGFIVIIEKDWISFGHQFKYRTGLYNKADIYEDQYSPVFLQWLDCMYQLITQFPYDFEINNCLLLFLAEHLNSGLFGTFLYNSDKERADNKADHQTISIWSYVMKFKEKYTNPYFNKERINKYLIPSYSSHSLKFWEQYFDMWDYYKPTIPKILENSKIRINNL